MKNLKKTSIGLGLVLATALVAGCTAEAGAADYVANEPVAVEIVEPQTNEFIEVDTKAADVVFQSDDITIVEVALFTLENSGFTLGEPVDINTNEGMFRTPQDELLYFGIETHSQSLADFTRADSHDFLNRLFFIDTVALTELDELWDSPAGRGSVGDFRLDVDTEQFWIGDSWDADAFDKYLYGFQDFQNGVPATILLMESDMFTYSNYLFRPVDYRLFNNLRMRAVGIVNDDDTIDVQFKFDNVIELVEVEFVENDFGSYSIHIYVNQGGSATHDTAWRLSSDNRELFSEWSRSILIDFIDAETRERVHAVFVNDTLPRLGEIRLFPELIEAERQLRIQYLSNSGN